MAYEHGRATLSAAQSTDDAQVLLIPIPQDGLDYEFEYRLAGTFVGTVQCQDDQSGSFAGIATVIGGEAGATGGITAVSIANPSQITTDAAHGLSSGQTVDITNVGTTPDINGQHVVTVTGSTTFTIPINVTAVADGIGDWARVVVAADPTAVGNFVAAVVSGAKTIRLLFSAYTSGSVEIIGVLIPTGIV